MTRFSTAVALVLVLFGPAPAHALYDYAVTGVARGDVLNIRRDVASARTVSDAEIVGTIPADATGVAGTGVTVLLGDSLWREVSYGGVTGWVADRYLRPLEGQGSGQPPASLTCSGTEPFWSMEFRDGGGVRKDPSSDAGVDYVAAPPQFARGRNHVWSIALQRADQSTIAAGTFIRTDRCSDGMSDFTYPFEFVLTEFGAGGLVLSGCCQLAR